VLLQSNHKVIPSKFLYKLDAVYIIFIYIYICNHNTVFLVKAQQNAILIMQLSLSFSLFVEKFNLLNILYRDNTVEHELKYSNSFTIQKLHKYLNTFINHIFA